ncbi:calmodulin-binding protein 60 C-like isoform X2 [Phragmites australis]|uniref:calmodulin-binding protein 60 C-like isoform X2 n=1 Tax=Phragmites australis TaxID=29695 RepID=UPI002D7831C7|nr:calmodulin-binding protein 60 C-like isoform X2 [Phragmites australis]
MPPKRRRVGGGGGGGGDRVEGGGGRSTPPPPPALKRRCRSFDLEIRGCRHHQELATRVEAIETAVSRIPEELRKVLTSFFNHVPGARFEQNLPPTYELRFVNSLSDDIFTKREVRAGDGSQIKIRMVVSNQQGSNCPRLLSANVKIVVLDGDFNVDNREVWTSEEFDNHIVRPRDKVGAVLTGKLDVKLEKGEAYLPKVTFIDNSSFTRSRKFRLGVKLTDDLGERVQEGITEPFTVKDRRGEGYKKRDIPRSDDEVWRLKKIAKGGVFHEALEQSGIPSVKHLLRLYYKDAKALSNILNASQSVWTTIVDHAKKCDPGRSLYSHFLEDKKIRLYFSSLGQIVGATIAGQYNDFGDLDTPWKAQLEKWGKDVYECITYHQPDYEMYNSQPRPINCSTLQYSITPGPKSTEPTDQNIRELGEQDTSKGNGFSGTHSQQCTFRRLGSVRVRTLPSAQENNETDAYFDIDVQLGSGPEIHYGTPDANYNTGSVTLNCPTTATGEIIASVALDQAALTMHQGDYQMPFTNDDPLYGHWYPEQQVTSQYASPFSLSMQADLPVLSTQNNFSMDQLFENMPDDNPQFCAPVVSELPTDVHSDMKKLPSYRRWVKLIAPVKWKAMVRASKRARLMLEQEGWSS